MPGRIIPKVNECIGFCYPLVPTSHDPPDTSGLSSLFSRFGRGESLPWEEYAERLSAGRDLTKFFSELTEALSDNTSRLVLMVARSSAYMALGRTVNADHLYAYAAQERTAGSFGTAKYTFGVSMRFDEVHIWPKNAPSAVKKNIALPLERAVWDRLDQRQCNLEVSAGDILLGGFIRQVGRFSRVVEVARVALEGHIDR